MCVRGRTLLADARLGVYLLEHAVDVDVVRLALACRGAREGRKGERRARGSSEAGRVRGPPDAPPMGAFLRGFFPPSPAAFTVFALFFDAAALAMVEVVSAGARAAMLNKKTC